MSSNKLLAGIALIAVIVVAGVMLTRTDSDLRVCAPDQPANSPNNPSPPDRVFCYEATAAGEEIVINFWLDEGAYLYKEKFGFASADPAVVFDTPRLPAGEMYEDEFFGAQEVYRRGFQLAIPYSRMADVASVDVEMELQGCDETIGLCYPPQDWVTTVSLPDGPIAAAPAPSQAASTNSNVPELFASAATSDEPLPIEQAFIPNPRFDAANELTIAWQIEPGYYLYRDSFTFTVEEGDIQFTEAHMPTGRLYEDLEFGEVEVYFDNVETIAPFARAHPNEQTLVITAGYRGCKEGSICYPPDEHQFTLNLPASGEFAVSEPGGAPAPIPVRVSEQDALADLISNGHLFAVIGTFFVLGLGLSLTPCVYPMIPILSGIITGQGNISQSRAFGLSVAYVLGMAATYSAAGAITAMAGSQVQAVFQQPWIIVSVAILFGAMALAMFGLFELQMPAAIQTRISALANRQKGGSFFSTAIVGALSALILTTCVAPPLIAGLISISQSGDVARGSLALFILALGMGVPLLLVGASAGKLLPKVGPWMNTIKAGFGVVMIGMAIWMLDRILPGTVTLVLWALLVFMTGVFLGAFEPLPENPRPARRLSKGVGVLACLYGALLLIGSTLGGQSPLRPIPNGVGTFAGQATTTTAREFTEVMTVAELDVLLEQARDAGQPVMVDFTADWCSDCKKMEAYTFPDPSVVAALEPYMLLKIDITANDDDDKELLNRFDTIGPPWMVFFDRYGRELGSGWTLAGYKDADVFTEHVTDVAAL